MNADLDARFCAVKAFQVFRDRHRPGSPRFDELDHAIDLALQPRRVVDAFLARNTLRDARRILRRRRERRRLTLESDFNATNGNALPLGDLLIDLGSPEEEAIAAEIAARVTSNFLTAYDGTRTINLVDLLIDGRTTREIAKLVSISPSCAAQLSRQLKNDVLAATLVATK